VQITLVEGAVDVTGPGLQAAGVDLKPGQQLIVGRDKAQPQPIDPARVTSWTTGQLIFNDLPLEEATAEINRYAVHKIVLAPDGVGAIRVSGAFHTNDADAFAQAIAQLYDLDQRQQPDGTIRINRPMAPEVVKKSSDPPG
jgi:transmembrane sensor